MSAEPSRIRPPLSKKAVAAFAIAATAISVALAVIFWSASPQQGSWLGIASELLESVVALIAAAACVLSVARVPRRELRSTWICFAISAALWALGHLAWTFADATWHVPGTGLSVPDLGYLGAVPPAIAGLAMLPRVREYRAESWLRVVVDATLVIASLLFVSWGTVLGPIYANDRAALWSTANGLAHPGLDVMLAAAVVIALSRYAMSAPRFVVMLGTGVVINVLADSVITYLRATSAATPAYPLEVATIAGFALIAAAALQSILDPAPPRAPKEQERWVVLSPYALLVIAGFVGCVKLITTGQIRGFLAWDGLVIAVVVAVRQWLLVGESQGLADEVQRRNADLDQIIKERTIALTESLEMMHQANDQRRRLLLRLMSSQEHERRRISDIIHDDMLQTVSIAQLQLYALRRKGIPEELEPRFAKLTKSIEDSSVALRELMSDLRLQALELGFQTAIERVIEVHDTKNDGEITLVNGITDEPQPSLAASMYRNIREALANVSKHAPGADVTVTLEATPTQYIVSVADNGPGFVVADARSPEGHIGLSSMHESVEALGGSIVLSSEPGQGTKVQFFLPTHVDHSIEADHTMGGGAHAGADPAFAATQPAEEQPAAT